MMHRVLLFFLPLLKLRAVLNKAESSDGAICIFECRVQCWCLLWGKVHDTLYLQMVLGHHFVFKCACSWTLGCLLWFIEKVSNLRIHICEPFKVLYSTNLVIYTPLSHCTARQVTSLFPCLAIQFHASPPNLQPNKWTMNYHQKLSSRGVGVGGFDDSGSCKVK